LRLASFKAMGACLSTQQQQYQTSSPSQDDVRPGPAVYACGKGRLQQSQQGSGQDEAASSGSGPPLVHQARTSTSCDPGGQPLLRQPRSSVSRNSLLIEAASGLKEEARTALADFHVSSHQGLHNLQTESELLRDLYLTETLGSGGFAAVLRGFWRGSTEVAVKCFTTRPGEAYQNDDQPPARALTEALLARDLAHPNIIRTFDVRCCRLSRNFLDATRGNKFNSDSSSSRNRSTSVQSIIDSYTGTTPLWLCTAPTPIYHPAEFDGGDVDAMQSGDGFGAVNRGCNQPPLSWSELLLCLGGNIKDGDYLTVIIMQHASFGTLGSAIKKHVFSSASNQSSDRRRRFRALLRTAREIAMAVEHLHAVNVVHGDLKPANVLLQDSRADTRGFTALVSDFGLSHLLSGSTHHFSQNAHGTTSYLAPELLMEGAVHRGVDVYAFGIMLFEMVVGQPAWGPDMRQSQVLMGVMAGKRPDMGPVYEPGLVHLKNLYTRCVAQDPAARPTAAQLVGELTLLEEGAHRSAVRSSREEARRSMEAATRQLQDMATAPMNNMGKGNRTRRQDSGTEQPSPHYSRAATGESNHGA